MSTPREILVEQANKEVAVNASRALELLATEGWEYEGEITPEDLPDALDDLMAEEELDPELRVQLEAFGKAIRKGVARAAHVAGRVAGGIQRARARVAMRKNKFKRGLRSIKRTAKKSFQAGRANKPVPGRRPGGKLTPAQRKQRMLAAKNSAKRRKGKKRMPARK